MEHAYDGKTFVSIFEKANSQEQNGSQQYHFLHGPSQKGQQFYRLKQIDKTGKIIKSKIIQTWLVHLASPYLLSNPVHHQLTIHQVPNNAVLTIVSAAGQVVQQITVQNAGNYIENVAALPNGWYFLKIQSREGITTMPFVKQ